MKEKMKDRLSGVLEESKQLNFRQWFMVGILLFMTLADILIDYVNTGFDPAIFTDAAYWVKLGLTCLSIVLITLAVRSLFREKELTQNNHVSRVQDDIDGAHAELMRHNLATSFEDHVNNINEVRKLKAYKDWVQYKLLKAKDKDKAKFEALLENAETDIEYLPCKGNKIRVEFLKTVKYNKIRIATIFSRNKLRSSDDEDIEDNEQAHVNSLIYRKLLMLIAFSITLSTLFFDTGDFAVAVLINTFSKLFRIAMSIYLGASDGQEFVRGTLLSKMKLRLDFIQKFLEKQKSERLTD